MVTNKFRGVFADVEIDRLYTALVFRNGMQIALQLRYGSISSAPKALSYGEKIAKIGPAHRKLFD